MNFLPEDYQSPKPTSQLYFRPLDGENRIRILSKPIFGWEDWTIDKKPVRFQMNEKPVKPIDPKKSIKHFWAFIVWNVQLEQIQIMQITQATIRSSIEALCKNKEWGSPYEYDIIISKKGEGIETEYSVLPTKPSPVSKEILQAFKDKPIQLEALFISADPFSGEWDSFTLLMPEAENKKIQPITQMMGEPVEKMNVKPLYIEDNLISYDEFSELDKLREGCSKETQTGFDDYLKKAFGIESLVKLEVKNYEEIKEKLTVRFNENKGKKK